MAEHTACPSTNTHIPSINVHVLKPINSMLQLSNCMLHPKPVRVPLKEKRLFNQIQSDSQTHTDTSDIPLKKIKVFEIVRAKCDSIIIPSSAIAVSSSNTKSRLNGVYFENSSEDLHINTSITTLELGCSENIEHAQARQHNTPIVDQQIGCDNCSSPIDTSTFELLISQELDNRPDCNYFERTQMHLTKFMRSILVDWMMEVCSEYHLKRETFYLSINYVDRYLSTVANVEKNELQLIGATAMYIAAKYEEIYPPKVQEFAKATDNGFTSEQIISTELKICKVLY